MLRILEGALHNSLFKNVEKPDITLDKIINGIALIVHKNKK